jgi:hypothetical protein
MTPRKPKQHIHHHHRNSSLIQPSDYESDAQSYPIHLPPVTRTNTELNLSVLQRYRPSIRTILSIAANAVIYSFLSSQQWEKSAIEGTMFVCEEDLDPKTGLERYCIVVLNRRGLDNLIVDLGQIQDIEIQNGLVILQFKKVSDDDEMGKTIGIWIHEDKDDTRDVNIGLIQQCWERLNPANSINLEQDNVETGFPDGTLKYNNNLPSTEDTTTGRRISLTDLFRDQSSQ